MTVCTIGTHVFILLVLLCQHWISSVPPKRKHIAVNTVRISAPASVVIKSAPTAPTQSVPKKPPPPQVKKTVAVKPTQVPKSKSKAAAPVVKKVIPKPEPKQDPKQELKPEPKTVLIPELVQDIEKNLAAISASLLPEKKTDLIVPTLEDVVIETTATEKVAVFMKEMLQLPEFGKVKVLVMIDRYGILQKFEVLESQSEKNAEFLKNQLPALSFPCLNETVSLTIVFSNEI